MIWKEGRTKSGKDLKRNTRREGCENSVKVSVHENTAIDYVRFRSRSTKVYRLCVLTEILT